MNRRRPLSHLAGHTGQASQRSRNAQGQQVRAEYAGSDNEGGQGKDILDHGQHGLAHALIGEADLNDAVHRWPFHHRPVDGRGFGVERKRGHGCG